VIKKHGRYYWLDIWIEGKRIRRSLKTTEHGLALEKARDIKNELVAKAQMKDSKNWEATVRGKGDRIRTVPLNTAARAIVERQRRQTAYVFPVENREQQDLFRRTVLQVRTLTGIPFHFHLGRHYFATTLLERGVDIVTISSILGHSKMMTSLLYSHTDREKKKKAVDLLF